MHSLLPVRVFCTVQSIYHFYIVCCLRNLSQSAEGTVEEIGFEEFLVVMSYFRPPSHSMTEEQRESVRKEKLRCELKHTQKGGSSFTLTHFIVLL